MSSNRRLSRLCIFASLVTLGFIPSASYAQTSALAAPRVQGPVNESQLATLQKNVLPLAQPRSDPQALQWLRGRESHCWPADFASCNHRQAADLPGRMEGATEMRD